MIEGGESCRVGFLPRAMMKFKSQLDGKFAQVVVFYSDSDDRMLRERDHRMQGVAECVMLDDVPYLE